MSPRPYRMTRRSESAEETRRRIVHATYELHAEKGIAATTVRDIAERADVAVGSVYHHFPTYDDVIAACGAYTHTVTRPPGPEIFDGIRGARARLRALVEAQFSFYRRFPGFERVCADRGHFPVLDASLRAQEEIRRALIAAAVAPRRVSRRACSVAFALLEVSVYRTLIRDGGSHATAVDEIASLLERRLLERRSTSGKESS